MLSIVIPTFNEAGTIGGLLEELKIKLADCRIDDYEILVMDDDSPDDTCGVVDRFGDKRIRSYNRRGKKRGLSYAVIDGFAMSKGDVLGVMDADNSHPVSAIPSLMKAINSGANLAIASRYVREGGIWNWPLKRRITSKVACWMARPLTSVKDATSGYFFLKKSILDGVIINPLGFKIGLEILVKSRHENKITEVPYIFRDRTQGKSKLSASTISDYMKQLILLLTYRRH